MLSPLSRDACTNRCDGLVMDALTSTLGVLMRPLHLTRPLMRTSPTGFRPDLLEVFLEIESAASNPYPGVFVLTLTILSSAMVVVVWILRRRLAEWIYKGHTFLRGLTLLTKLKILIGFGQIVIKIESVYDVYLPADVRALIQKIRIVISLGIEVRDSLLA